MAKTSYFAIDPNGVKHTRTSKRVYTHMVVYQSSKQAYLDSIPGHKKQKAKDGQWYLDCVAVGYHKSLMQFPHYRDSAEEQAKSVADAIKRLDGATTAEEYGERFAQDMRDHAEQRDWNKWQSAGWCGRYDLAQKLAAQVGGMILPAVKA